MSFAKKLLWRRTIVPEEKARVLVLGDSHSVALKAGCDSVGLPAELLSFSGNFWHAGHIVSHRKIGLWARGAALQARINDTLKRLGRASLFGPDLVVLGSFGFHLGRIAPILGVRGHRADGEEFLADESTQFVSSAVVSAYVQVFRSPHLNIMRRISQQSPMVLVTPPRFSHDSSNHQSCFDAIKAGIQAANIPCYDPCIDLFSPGGVLPAAMVTPDGVHGNAEYGAMVVRRLIGTGVLPQPGGGD